LSNSPPLDTPEWVPPAVTEAGKQLHDQLATEKDPAKAQKVLSRLVSHPLMERVWREVFRKKRVQQKQIKEFLNPAFTYSLRVSAFRQKASDLRGKGGEANARDAESWEGEAAWLEAEAKLMEGEFDPLTHPRWSRQDRAAQILLQHAYRCALDDKPVFLSDLVKRTEDLRKLVQDFQSGVLILQSYKLDREARKLSKLAEAIDQAADDGDPYFDPRTEQRLVGSRFPDLDDPWVIVRDTCDAPMRSFVISLSIASMQLFGKALYNTLANITKVVFERNDVTDSVVREILRIRYERTD
jgi:hypothetical protein